MWGMTRRQWLVVFAAWLGWGFDVFDAVLFNFVAPNAIPTLLGLVPGTPEAKSATLQWNGLLSALLLVVWAVGGILFGYARRSSKCPLSFNFIAVNVNAFLSNKPTIKAQSI